MLSERLKINVIKEEQSLLPSQVSERHDFASKECINRKITISNHGQNVA